jgi:hypothetical protein
MTKPKRQRASRSGEAACSADTIRMNWLETVSCKIYGVAVPSGDITVLEWDTDGHTERTAEAATLRDAIDAAMLMPNMRLEERSAAE